MALSISERFSGILTKGDIEELFEKLKEKAGSTAAAARLAKLERKTVYKWREVKEIRKSTKEKVLTALLKQMPIETLEFLLEKYRERSGILLYNLLAVIVNTAIKSSNKDRRRELIERFHRDLELYGRPLADEVAEEIFRLQQSIKRVETLYK